MGTIKLKKQSPPSPPATDQLSLFIDSADNILKTIDSFGVIRPSGVGTADELATTGDPVDVSASAPPQPGYVLIATSETTAVWSSAAAQALGTSGADVEIGTAAPPSVGDILVAQTSSSASWQPPPAAQELATSGAPVVISAADPPVAGQALVAINSTSAEWTTTGTLTPTAIQPGGTTYDAVVGDLVRCDFSANDVDVQLPLGHSAGDQIGVKAVTAATGNTVWIYSIGSDTIDGDPELLLTTNHEWAILMSDGSNWMQIG